MTTVERTATIRNRLGLHARPAAEFVKLAGEFDADVWVVRGDLEVNGKSIMGVMMLAAEAGTRISIRAVGVDAETAVTRLVELVESGFGEEPAEGLEPTAEPR
ncbi:MAG: HPr family phosphocarrier protein [Gemmatimonadota bacterium]|nr:HPr family phosphocarrier protein [Gemmatimonadota bacterium]